MVNKEEDSNEIGEIIRQKTINKLLKYGLNLKDVYLPYINFSAKSYRSKEEIARRIVVLYSLKAISIYPEDMISIISFLKKNDYVDYMSKEEKKILKQKLLTNRQEIDFSWYKESLYVLLWYSNIIKDDVLRFPNDEIILEKKYLDLLPPENDYNFFESNLQIKENKKLFEELYFYYYLHWKVKKNNDLTFIERLLKSKNKKKINESVVIERRKALEWIADANLDWDDISLDT